MTDDDAAPYGCLCQTRAGKLKQGYATREHAEQGLAEVARKVGANGLLVYQCDAGTWHLGTRRQRTVQDALDELIARWGPF